MVHHLSSVAPGRRCARLSLRDSRKKTAEIGAPGEFRLRHTCKGESIISIFANHRQFLSIH